MGTFEDWLIGEILSFFAGETENSWHDKMEIEKQ